MAKPIQKPLFEIQTLDEPNEPADNLPSSSRQWEETLERTHQAKVTLHETFAKELLVDFQAHGAQAIRDMREKNPSSYIKIIKDFLPKEISIDVTERKDATSQYVNAQRLSIIRDLISGANEDRRAAIASGDGNAHLPPADEGEGEDGLVLSADQYLEQKGLLAPMDT